MPAAAGSLCIGRKHEMRAKFIHHRRADAFDALQVVGRRVRCARFAIGKNIGRPRRTEARHCRELGRSRAVRIDAVFQVRRMLALASLRIAHNAGRL